MTKATKKARKQRARKPRNAPAADGAVTTQHNGKPVLSPDEERALFLSHRGIVEAAFAKVEAAKKSLRTVQDDARREGFPKKLFEIARGLAGDVKAEKKVTGEVRDRLRVARWIGHPLGSQLDLFSEPDRTPSVDRAFDMGKQASMQNEPAKPPFAPETEQYRSWMAGYGEHQATLGDRVGRGPEAAAGTEPFMPGKPPYMRTEPDADAEL